MIKTIKIEYFDEFRCLIDKCPDNCCHGWSISIDEKTYNLNISELDSKIKSTEPHTMIKQMGKCPFLTESGLCRIHKEYGEEFLSDTCKAYPRFVSEYGDLFIENIGLSCPAVAQWLVSLDRKCQLEEQIYYENTAEFNKTFMKTEAELLMNAVVGFFMKETSIVDSIAECYRMFGVNDVLTMSSEFSENYSLLLQNISICYLFERIMLQSKKQNPNYVSVVERLCFMLKQFEEQCQKLYGDCGLYTSKQLATALYQTMRNYDHEI